MVIGIIGILVALATVSYSATQKSGRDARRKQDMIAIQNALEQYYSENDYKYPETCSDVAVEYLKSAWPSDPDGTGSYQYTTSCSTSSYCVCALMEKVGSGNAENTICTFGNTKTYYCVANLQ